MDLHAVLCTLFPTAKEGAWTLQDDGDGQYIKAWDNTLGPKPTEAERKEAWPEVEKQIKRAKKIEEIEAWYQTKKDGGVELEHGGQQYKLKAQSEDMYSISSLATGEAMDVDDPDTPTTINSETLLFDYHGVPRRMKIKDFRKVAIAYKNQLKAWNITVSLTLEELFSTADPDTVTLPE